MFADRSDRSTLFAAPLLLLLCQFVAQGCRTSMDPAQWGKDHQYGAHEVVPLTMGPHGFPLVPGKINDRDVKVFFDSGNFSGFQIGPDMARSLNLRPSGNERRNYGSDGTYRYSQKGYQVETFTALGTESENIEMFEMTDNAFEASVGIGSLVNGRFTLDLRNRFMGISHEPFENGQNEYHELPLIWNESLRGMIVVEGHVNGTVALLQIDTGKSRTTIDERLTVLAGLKENDSLFQKGYKVDSLTMGSKDFSVERAKVADFKGISEGYPQPILVGIGADILSRIVLTVDYTQKKVFIER